MKSLEVVLDGGLVIAREGIDPSLASDFQDEWLCNCGDYVNGLTHVWNMPVPLDGENRDGQDSPLVVGEATQRVLQTLKITEGSDLIMNVNWQPARTAQNFHKDLKLEKDLAIIVHGGDNGAFDYSPAAAADDETEAEEDHFTIELNAGDVVSSNQPYMFHRGRNLGDVLRVTGVITNPTRSKYPNQADYLASIGIKEYRPNLIKKALGRIGFAG